jgi:hypothetical protein
MLPSWSVQSTSAAWQAWRSAQVSDVMTKHELVSQHALLLQPCLYIRFAVNLRATGLQQVLLAYSGLQTSVGDTSRSSFLLLACFCSQAGASALLW